MNEFSKLTLSGSTGGKGIAVSATSSPGTTIHTTNNDGDLEEIWIYAINIASTDQDLTIQFGGTSASDGIAVSLPKKEGLLVIVPGFILEGTGLVVRAFGETSNDINIFGYVNKIKELPPL